MKVSSCHGEESFAGLASRRTLPNDVLHDAHAAERL
jgi:hypothetical protein